MPACSCCCRSCLACWLPSVLVAFASASAGCGGASLSAAEGSADGCAVDGLAVSEWLAVSEGMTLSVGLAVPVGMAVSSGLADCSGMAVCFGMVCVGSPDAALLSLPSSGSELERRSSSWDADAVGRFLVSVCGSGFGSASPSRRASSFSVSRDCSQMGRCCGRAGMARNWLLKLGVMGSPKPSSSSI